MNFNKVNPPQLVLVFTVGQNTICAQKCEIIFGALS